MCFAMPPTDLTKRKKEIDARIAKARAKPSIDTASPRCWVIAKIKSKQSNRRKTALKERHATISKHNLELAHRIFTIMDNPSQVTQYIHDTRHLEVHPGTMNFPARLSEAQRIHMRNLEMAKRLDNVEPYYNKAMLGKKEKKGGNKGDKKGKKKGSTTGVGHYMGNGAMLTQASHASASPSFKRAQNAHGVSPKASPRGAGAGDSSIGPGGPGQGAEIIAPRDEGNGRQVLLEYTKVQDGCVIDVAVIKEAFVDKYSIIGVDIESGIEYERHLTSNEVSAILDGDILVTSTDNVEVSMTLLSKVTLMPVAGQERNQADGGDGGDGDGMKAQDLESYFAPHAPDSAKPSTRPGARAGSRVNRRDKKQLGPKEEAPGAFDDDRGEAVLVATNPQTKGRLDSLDNHTEMREQQPGGGEEEGPSKPETEEAMVTPRGNSAPKDPPTERTKNEVRKASIALLNGLGIPGLQLSVPSTTTGDNQQGEALDGEDDKDEETRPAEVIKPSAPKGGSAGGGRRKIRGS